MSKRFSELLRMGGNVCHERCLLVRLESLGASRECAHIVVATDQDGPNCRLQRTR
jgi:hypothetical protein